MKKQLAILWLISLATLAGADPTLNSLQRASDAFKGQHTLKWAKQQEHNLDLADLFTPLGFSSEKKFAYSIGYNCSRSEEHTSELQSRFDLVCRLLLEKNNKNQNT